MSRKPVVLCTILAITCTVAVTTSAVAVVTERVSVDSSGNPGDSLSALGVISSDGRYVCFTSEASNLVPDDTNGVTDVFVMDRQTGVTTRVSVDANGLQGNDESLLGFFSADGAYAVFASYATNLVPGVNNGECQFYRKHLETGGIICVSTDFQGEQGNGGQPRGEVPIPTLNADGRYACFSTFATNLVPGDTNGAEDSFVKDCVTGELRRVSTKTGGGQVADGGYDPRMTGDARYVLFHSHSDELAPGHPGGFGQLFVKDLQTDVTTCVSVSSAGELGNEESNVGGLPFSADDNCVVFWSAASNLVGGDTNGTWDIFLRSRASGVTTRVSTTSDGSQANGPSWLPSISANGRYVTFSSDATNLVEDDTNGSTDVFVKDLVTGETKRVSVITGNGQKEPSVQANWWECVGVFDGRYAVWGSNAEGIVPVSGTGVNHVYVSDFAADPVAYAKAKWDGAAAIVSAGVVSSAFGDAFYFQQDGIASTPRASGIKVNWPGPVVVGKRYIVTGLMATGSKGERYIHATAVDPHTSEWTVEIDPLGMINRSVGSGDWLYNPGTGAGQQGIAGASGLNNIGLLIYTTGRVTYADTDYFYLDDGSKLDDGSGHLGVKVLATGLSIPPLDGYVQVTGISSCFKVGDDLHRLIRVRDQADIVVLE